MTKDTTITACSAKLKSGILKVSLSYICKDQEEFKRIELLKDTGALVDINVVEVKEDGHSQEQ